MAKYGYDPNVDYQAEIDKRIAEGDYVGAAVAEQMRNEKIAGEGLDYDQTNNFSSYLFGGALGGGGGGGQYYRSTASVPQYQSPYADDITRLLESISGYGDYDPSTDPTYQKRLAALTKDYTTRGQRAMQDTVGQVAARTGGLASSYATSAGADAYNYYMGQLSDKDIALQEQGEQRHLTGKNDLYSMLSTLMGLESSDYSRFRDTVGDQQHAQEYADMMAQQGLENDRWGLQWMNQLEQQDTENDRYDQQYEDSRSDYGDSRDDVNFQKAQSLLSMGFSSADIARVLGISEEQAQGYADMVQQGMRADLSNKQKTTNPSTSSMDTLFNDMQASGNPTLFLYSNYGKYGIAYSGLSKIMDEYSNWFDSGGSVPTFSDAKDAVNYLKDAGYDTSGMMTFADWSRHKASGSKDPAVAGNASYIDYVNDFVRYLISESI